MSSKNQTAKSNFTNAPAISIVVIATGKYYEYLIDLVKDLDSFGYGSELEVVIFTDRSENLISNENFDITHIEIPEEPWPDITLFRFSKILDHESLIRGKTVVWTDADMRIRRKFNPTEIVKGKNVYLSRHPGFSLNAKTLFGAKDKVVFIYKVISRIEIIIKHKKSTEGWETGKNYHCYVPLWRRRAYVQGGFWMAEKSVALEMCRRIIKQIGLDLAIDYIPTYHDETYLNWYKANFKTKLLPKDFVYVEDYYWQNQQLGFVECVDKSKVNYSK